MERLRRTIERYIPTCEQEKRDRETMLSFLNRSEDCLTRENRIAHFTASAWIANEKRDKVLMAYHNLYDSWSWTGGHADGEADLLQVAVREAKEETGIVSLRPISECPCALEILTVDGHIKRGEYVSSHLHLNLTYLFQAPEEQTLQAKPDENSGVRWIPVDELSRYVSEPWMLKWIYEKLSNLLTLPI